MATREEKMKLIEQLKVQIDIVADSLEDDAEEKTNRVPLSTLYLSDIMKKRKINEEHQQSQTGEHGTASGKTKDDPLDALIAELSSELGTLKSKLKSKKRK